MKQRSTANQDRATNNKKASDTDVSALMPSRVEPGLPSGANVRLQLAEMYERLEEGFGDLGWWPAETAEEMMIGAILVQNVTWKNTVKAIEALRDHGLLSLQAIHDGDETLIATCIRPTRFFNMKTRRLKAFAAHVTDRYAGHLDKLLHQPMEALRNELLSIEGIGEETADDIVLYAANQPSFVIDAYTRRILARCLQISPNVSYGELRHWFMNHLPKDVRMFNQFHALIDRLGHAVCLNRNPQCDICPLHPMCASPSPQSP